MQFGEDQISEFIRFKLNNPQALQEEMRLIEDRLECNRKLEDYAKQMDLLKNQLTNAKSMLQALAARREYIMNVSEEQKHQLEVQTAQCKQQLQSIKKETKGKHSSSDFHLKRFDEFRKETMIKKQMLIQSHQEELTRLDEQTEKLKFQKETRAAFKEELEYKLKKLRDRQKIVGNTILNVESVRDKWKTRYHELALAKEQQSKKQRQITELINYSNSMEKVIYSNLYKRCSNLIAELHEGLNSLYSQKTVNISELGWQERVQRQILKLKTNRDKFTKLMKDKRDKYLISPGLPEPKPDEYNLIVQTKINPNMFEHIDVANYTLSQQKYKEIQRAQNEQLDQLQAQKVSLQETEKARISQIQGLRKSISGLQEQIQIQQRALKPPIKKKK